MIILRRSRPDAALRAGEATGSPPLASVLLPIAVLLLGACAHTGSGGATATRELGARAAVTETRSLGGADCGRTSGYDALIVGAGLAGLAAGKELAHLGHSILVLEATDRVGGRGFVGQVSSGGADEPPVPIDYGGAWVHGVPTNPLTGLVDRMGFARVRSELDAPFWVDGREASAQDVERFDEAYEEYEEALSAAALAIEYEKAVAEQACAAAEDVEAGVRGAAELCALLDRSVPDNDSAARLCEAAGEVERGALDGESLCAAIEEQVRTTSDVAADYLPREERLADMAPLVAATAGPLETAAELDQSSAVDAAGFAAGEDDLVDRGMGTFVREYGEGVPICLSSPVTGIEYGEAGVEVDAAGRRYQATVALLTVSVGVLQAGTIDLEPPLPAWKRSAIEEIRMGHMQKVIIPFSEDIFGDVLANSWVLVDTAVTPAEREAARRMALGIADEERRVMAFFVKPLDARIAIAFYGGEWARLFESACAGKETTSGLRSASGCDDLAIDAAVRPLRARFGAEVVDRTILADRIHVTRWSLAPYTRGAYSVPLPGGWDERQVLARPVAAGAGGVEGPLRLFFAGEAASRAIFNGSYAGAWETGLAAARDIHLELLAEDAEE